MVLDPNFGSMGLTGFTEFDTNVSTTKVHVVVEPYVSLLLVRDTVIYWLHNVCLFLKKGQNKAVCFRNSLTILGMIPGSSKVVFSIISMVAMKRMR